MTCKGGSSQKGSDILPGALLAGIHSLERQARWGKRIGIGLVVILGVLIVLFIQQHREVVSNCQAGNSFRAGQTQNWATFIGLATAGSNDPAAMEKAQQLMKAVEKHDMPRNCPSNWDLTGGF